MFLFCYLDPKFFLNLGYSFLIIALFSLFFFFNYIFFVFILCQCFLFLLTFLIFFVALFYLVLSCIILPCSFCHILLPYSFPYFSPYFLFTFLLSPLYISCNLTFCIPDTKLFNCNKLCRFFQKT